MNLNVRTTDPALNDPGVDVVSHSILPKSFVIAVVSARDRTSDKQAENSRAQMDLKEIRSIE